MTATVDQQTLPRLWPTLVSAGLYLLLVAGSLAVYSVGFAQSWGVNEDELPRIGPGDAEILILVLANAVLPVWLWLPGMILALISRWWSPRERLLAITSPLIGAVGVMAAIGIDGVGLPDLLSFGFMVLWHVGLITVLARLAVVAARRVRAARRAGHPAPPEGS